MAEETLAHDQKETLHIVCHYPEHAPRAGDPHFAAFAASKARIKALGLWKCAIGDRYCAPALELHHNLIEYALQGGVDLAKFNALYGLHLDDAGFRAYIESPSALEVLCETHHRTHLGIHTLPSPLWSALRLWRDDLPPPAEVVTGAA